MSGKRSAKRAKKARAISYKRTVSGVNEQGKTSGGKVGQMSAKSYRVNEDAASKEHRAGSGKAAPAGRINIGSVNVSYITLIAFIALMASYTFLLFELFKNQAFHTDYLVYGSDVDAYLLEMQGIDSGFDFPYPVYFLLGKFFALFSNVNMGAALSATVLNSLSPVFLSYFMLRELSVHVSLKSKNRTAYEGFILLVTFSVFFVSMLYAPEGYYIPGIPLRNLGVYSANPYYNQTYLAARGFAIVAFFLFAHILTYYEKHTDIKEYVAFSVFLLLATLTKPSFTLVLVSAAAVHMIVKLIMSRGKNLKGFINLLLTAVPTFITLMIQFGGVFGADSHAGSEGGIGIGIGKAWHVYTNNIVIAVMLACAFPGLMMLLNFKRFRDHAVFRLSWEIMMAGFLEFLLLYEKGDRFTHNNFAWGYMYGILFVFISGTLLLIENTVRKKQAFPALVLEWCVYLMHLVCGVAFFKMLYLGGYFYV
ncbi:MAG: hypothetical protein ILP17_08085 [Lachnospiraceae bacterium]|nr:hypothetical protein [Lachnospiraceae bacterium]